MNANEARFLANQHFARFRDKAYNEGWCASSPSENPYTETSLCSNSWKSGFSDAQKEREV